MRLACRHPDPVRLFLASAWARGPLLAPFLPSLLSAMADALLTACALPSTVAYVAGVPPWCCPHRRLGASSAPSVADSRPRRAVALKRRRGVLRPPGAQVGPSWRWSPASPRMAAAGGSTPGDARGEGGAEGGQGDSGGDEGAAGGAEGTPTAAAYVPGSEDRPEGVGNELPTSLTLSQQLLLKQYVEQVRTMSEQQCKELTVEVVRRLHTVSFWVIGCGDSCNDGAAHSTRSVC